MYVYIYVCVCVCVYMCMSIYMYVCVYMCVCVCVCVYIFFLCVCVCMYIYIPRGESEIIKLNTSVADAALHALGNMNPLHKNGCLSPQQHESQSEINKSIEGNQSQN